MDPDPKQKFAEKNPFDCTDWREKGGLMHWCIHDINRHSLELDKRSTLDNPNGQLVMSRNAWNSQTVENVRRIEDERKKNTLCGFDATMRPRRMNNHDLWYSFTSQDKSKKTFPEYQSEVGDLLPGSRPIYVSN